MASTSTALSLSSSSTLFDGKAPRHLPAASPQCVSLPALPPTWKSAVYCRKISRNVVAMATGEAPAEVAATELPEVVKTLQEAWDKLDDKYAVTTLVFAGVVALWVSTGMISAIDRLPLVPGVLELVGIGYSGWFVYQNLVFKPDSNKLLLVHEYRNFREALFKKINDTYKDVIGTS
ncbi:hypothetical protein HHK36_027362 [Tetracentron sinense]|uniref:Cyanobacterial aminoacyl-tRNA synthetase CAAD domain-containing protein n=1 Tax=Tetracentron sinense TaxID=13715 RepID=A0A835D112_TETSI|nr:hypothetical protein HHK36_027362 [Tetracentron sinense]